MTLEEKKAEEYLQSIEGDDCVIIKDREERKQAYIVGYHDAEEHYMNVIDKQHRLADGTKEKGILLFHKGCREYMVFFTYSMWYGNDEYDYNSYGKAYLMKGLKPEDLELIESYLGRSK